MVDYSQLSALGRIIIKSFTRFAAEPARSNIAAQENRWAIFGITELAIKNLANGKHGIEADEIYKGQRTHRVPQS